MSTTVSAVLRSLKKLYNPPRTFLRFRTPLDLVVVTILSAQCTDARVNIVSRELFRKYRTAKDYLAVSRGELQRAVHSCGTYRVKAKHIQELCRMLIDRHDGRVPRTMEELIALPGVGRKTANVILSAAFGVIEGIAVDTHVRRVARRLGFTRSGDPKRIELDLMAQTPRKEWGNLTTLLISHGRAVCTARNRACERCVFKTSCPSSRIMGKRDLAAAETSS